MKKSAIAAALALAVGGAAFAQNAAAPADATPARPAPRSEPAVAAGLSDLESMTFPCPKAALNAAAREAARIPSQGTYQFSYFNTVSASQHGAYEVHFTSNYAGEAPLKFCVAIYCQQGFDPATTKTSVTHIGAKAVGQGDGVNACSSAPRTPARRGTTR